MVYNPHVLAGVMESVDVPHSKCGGATRAGSSPATGTKYDKARNLRITGFSLCYQGLRAFPVSSILESIYIITMK